MASGGEKFRSSLLSRSSEIINDLEENLDENISDEENTINPSQSDGTPFPSLLRMSTPKATVEQGDDDNDKPLEPCDVDVSGKLEIITINEHQMKNIS